MFNLDPLSMSCKADVSYQTGKGALCLLSSTSRHVSILLCLSSAPIAIFHRFATVVLYCIVNGLQYHYPATLTPQSVSRGGESCSCSERIK